MAVRYNAKEQTKKKIAAQIQILVSKKKKRGIKLGKSNGFTVPKVFMAWLIPISPKT
jgi:hypothetical protein